MNAPGIVDLGLLINGGNYRVRGVKTYLIARLASGLSIEAGGAWDHSELVKQRPFLWADGKPRSLVVIWIGHERTHNRRDAPVHDCRRVKATE